MSLHSPQNAHTHTTHMYSHPRPLHTFPIYTRPESPHKPAHRHTQSTCTPTSPITHTQLAHNLSPIHSPHTPTHTHIPHLHLPYTSTPHARTRVTCPSPAAHTHSYTHKNLTITRLPHPICPVHTQTGPHTCRAHARKTPPQQALPPPATNAEKCGKAPSPKPWEERFFPLTGSLLLSASEGPVRLPGRLGAEPAGKACLPARCALWGCSKS